MSIPRHSIFISYRIRDSSYAVDRLDERLKQAFGEQAVFHDVRSIGKGESFPGDIRDALQVTSVGLVVIGPLWLEVTDKRTGKRRIDEPGDWVRIEIETLLQRQTTTGALIPVIPVLLGGERPPQAEALPDSIKLLAARNAHHLRPEPDFEDSIRQLIEHIAKMLGVEPQPFGPERASISTTPIPIDISRIFKYAPAELLGREVETKILADAWDQAVRGEKDRPHVLTFVALGGEGAFAWSFYSQGSRDQATVSSDLFLAEALRFFGDAEMAGSAQGAFDKARRLAQLVGQRRALLILDGLEPLQYPPGPPLHGKLKDEALAELLKRLAANSQGLCVVTTRYSIPDLKAYWNKTVQEIPLPRLSRAAGVALLQSFDVKGSLLRNIASPDGQEQWNEFEKLVEDVRGHALTLNLLGSYLRDAHGGDIRRRDLVKLEEADAEEQGGHAFRVLDAYVKSFETGGKSADDLAKNQRALALLSLLGLFDRPATADCLQALWSGEPIAGLTEPLVGLSEAQRNLALKRLEEARLLTVNRAAAGTLLSLDAHPQIREYFAARLRGTGFQPVVNSDNHGLEARATAWRAAHRRLYEHLCATTPDKPDATLEDLQPLYQAVAHGCYAGLQQEACDKVYRDRIQRGGEAYSASKLGAFGSDLGTVACFFEPPWNHVSPELIEPAQAWLLNEAATRLRALGRLTEALEPMWAVLERDVKQESWIEAAISASNLSELELTLGEVARAEEDAARSVTYADCSGNAPQRMTNRTTHADALHQAGRWDEAEALFRKAEQMQAESQPAYPLLYSVRGSRYCDLLLAAAERAAWQMVAFGSAKERSFRGAKGDINECRDVPQRATQTLKIAEEHFGRGLGLLDIALDHLTLGRAALYAAILDSSRLELRVPSSELDLAVSGLRRAGTTHHLPRALLTRAWLRSLTSVWTGPDSAQSDLDEAWEIAERGPMPLFLADIHLYRARLFGLRNAAEKYPWDSPQHDLAEARRQIEKCGYWRRKEELEDAERALHPLR